MHLESIPLEEYIRFASMHFKRAGKEIEESAVTTVYQQFEGITWYIQKVLSLLKIQEQRLTVDFMSWDPKTLP